MCGDGGRGVVFGCMLAWWGRWSGRPAAGSVVRALEAVAREGDRLGVHLVAAAGHSERVAATAHGMLEDGAERWIGEKATVTANGDPQGDDLSIVRAVAGAVWEASDASGISWSIEAGDDRARDALDRWSLMQANGADD